MVSVVAKKLHKARQEKGRYNVKFCFKEFWKNFRNTPVCDHDSQSNELNLFV